MKTHASSHAKSVEEAPSSNPFSNEGPLETNEMLPSASLEPEISGDVSEDGGGSDYVPEGLEEDYGDQSEDQEKSEVENDPGVVYQVCKKCGGSFNNKKNLIKHMRHRCFQREDVEKWDHRCQQCFENGLWQKSLFVRSGH